MQKKIFHIFQVLKVVGPLKNAITKAVEDEVMNSLFVTISMDETSDIKTLSQLTTIIHYVNADGKSMERFLGFSNVSEDRTAARLKQEVEYFEEYRCGGKLIARTCDGASVMSGQLNRLQVCVRDDYPHALFIHCCWGHALNLVLAQAVSSTKECRVFLKLSVAFLPPLIKENVSVRHDCW